MKNQYRGGLPKKGGDLDSLQGGGGDDVTIKRPYRVDVLLH